MKSLFAALLLCALAGQAWTLLWAHRRYYRGYLTGQLDALELAASHERQLMETMTDELAEPWVMDGIKPQNPRKQYERTN